MISAPTVLCALAGVLVLRPWRVRPRSLRLSEPEAPEGRPLRIPALPAGAARGAGIVAATVVHPALGVVLVVGPWVRRVRRRRRDEAAVQRSIVRALPEVVDLIVLGVGAGLTPRAALARCEAWLPPPFGAAFGEARRRATAGESFSTALEGSVGKLGVAAQPLMAVVLGAEQTVGSNLAPLRRVGDEARRQRRVEAQERARRLPVTMLLPLVLCVLPAFGLLAVAPLLIGSFRDLGLGS